MRFKFSWMILVAAVAGAVVVVAPWVAVFPWQVSTAPDDWAAFGAYLGGTLSPFIATLALVAFLRTLSQQQSQIEQLQAQSAKSDLLAVIERLEEDYEKALRMYPIVVNYDGRRYDYTGIDVVTRFAFPGWEQAIVNLEEVEMRLAEKGELPKDDQNIHAMEMFSMAAGHLNQLRLYVEQHDEIAGNNALTKYYQRKHKLAYERFVARGILETSWQTKEQSNQTVERTC